MSGCPPGAVSKAERTLISAFAHASQVQADGRDTGTLLYDIA